MTFIKLNPVSEIQRLNKLFENFKNFADFEIEQDNLLKVRVDVLEDDQNLQIVLELPGIAKEDVTISIDNERKLTIKGEKKRPSNYENRNIIRCETNYGKFSRSFILSNDLDDTQISAKFQDGLLILNIPKKKKEEVEKIISIN